MTRNPAPLIRPLKMNINLETVRREGEARVAHMDHSNLGIMRGKVPSRAYWPFLRSLYLYPFLSLLPRFLRSIFFPFLSARENYMRDGACTLKKQIRFLPRLGSVWRSFVRERRNERGQRERVVRWRAYKGFGERDEKGRDSSGDCTKESDVIRWQKSTRPGNGSETRCKNAAKASVDAIAGRINSFVWQLREFSRVVRGYNAKRKSCNRRPATLWFFLPFLLHLVYDSHRRCGIVRHCNLSRIQVTAYSRVTSSFRK